MTAANQAQHEYTERRSRHDPHLVVVGCACEWRYDHYVTEVLGLALYGRHLQDALNKGATG